MKKLFLGATVALSLCATSCCNGVDCAEKSAADTLSTVYGSYVGIMINSDYNNMGEHSDADVADFIKGVQYALTCDNDEMTLGLQVGLQMASELSRMEAGGAKINKALVMNAFKKSLMAEEVDFSAASEYQMKMRTLMQQIEEAEEARQTAELLNSPEAKANEALAAQQVEALKAADPEVMVSESGLVYKIENPGEGEHPTNTSTVSVHYVGSHLNGEVFDSSRERNNPASFNLQGVVPGFSEGLQLLGKGGKATIYIPGELGYGAKGQPQAGIGPNEMLVFEIELLDILN